MTETEMDERIVLILGTAQFQSGYGIVRDLDQAGEPAGPSLFELAPITGGSSASPSQS